jgi:hypothetical protein
MKKNVFMFVFLIVWIITGAVLTAFVQIGVPKGVWEPSNQKQIPIRKSKLLKEQSFVQQKSADTFPLTQQEAVADPKIKIESETISEELSEKDMFGGGDTKLGGGVMYTSKSGATWQEGGKHNPQGNSGLKGQTIFRMHSGAAGGGTTETRSSMEFAIAPVKDDSPIYSRAIFIKSDEQGNYEVSLPPGRYWIGPKEKALDPKKFEGSRRAPIVFSEKIVVVKEGVFAHVDVLREATPP